MSRLVTAADTQGVLAAERTEQGFSPGWDHVGISLPELPSVKYVIEAVLLTCVWKRNVTWGKDPARGHSAPSICSQSSVGTCPDQACVPRGEVALEQTIAVIGSLSDSGSCCPVVQMMEMRIV